jgi:hypothetical protein
LKRYSGIIILPLLVAFILAPFEVPFNIESVTRVLPARQWVLLKASNGALSATLYDHRTGQVSNQEGYEFDRGDLVQVRFQQGSRTVRSVRAGETVATISSNQLGEQLMQLKNQLAVEQANLSVVATGQKSQVILQKEEEINLAKADLDWRQKTLERMRQLHRDGLIPTTSLEQAENAYHESLARVRVAEKALLVSATGEKQETISLATSKLTSLQKEIAFLENKQKKYTLTAPFDGQMRFETALEGDRLLVEDTATLILQIPVRLRDSRFVSAGQKIELQLLDRQTSVTALILEVGNRVEILNREQVVMVKAVADHGAPELPPGTPIRCRIDCGKVRVAEFLKRSVRWQ